MMTKQMICLALVALLGLPALADDNKSADLVGTWLLSSINVNGEDQEDDSIGKSKMVFSKDGTVKSIEGEDDDTTGWYEVKADGKLHLYEDLDGDGKLDDEEKEESESFDWGVKGKELTLTMELEFGDESVKIIAKLKKVD